MPPSQLAATALAAAVLFSTAVAQGNQSLPLPFTRVLKFNDTGSDVYIAQNLLKRFTPGVAVTSIYDAATLEGVANLQLKYSIPITGALDAPTASALLDCCSRDGYVDDGKPPSELGYQYKVHLRVYQNRSNEVTARLLAGNGTVLLEFIARAHGVDGPSNSSVWPYYSNCCDGLNEFSPDGNTPTGLSEFDLNTPEGNPVPYGPWPVNRLVKGLAGNAAFLVTNEANTTIRDGILLHTGQWSNHSSFPWAPPDPMVRQRATLLKPR